ncbi:long-chain fatty acid--CoA ligase [Deltaproteobacteria bacterium TL4]
MFDLSKITSQINLNHYKETITWGLEKIQQLFPLIDVEEQLNKSLNELLGLTKEAEEPEVEAPSVEMKPNSLLNLASILENSAREFPTQIAIILGEKQFNYAQLNGAANQIANGLKDAGINKGDRVVLSCPNLPFFPMVYFGILKIGAVVVPINVLLKEREIEYHLNDSGAKAYFCFEGTPELPMGERGWKAVKAVKACKHFILMTANPAAESPIKGAKTLGAFMANQSPLGAAVTTSPEDSAVILYTSGTTGNPKGAELSHANLLMNTMVARDLIQGKIGETQLVVLPLFHSFGQVVQMNSGILCGHTLVLLPRFDPETVWKTFESRNINIFCGVPTMYWALLNYPKASEFHLVKIAQHLRLCASGGAAIPVEIIKQFEATFDVPILEGYGLSETSPIATFNHVHKKRIPGSVGTPVWGVDVKIVDSNDNELPPEEVGEIIIRGHNVMKGYFNRPDATKEAIRNGWFHSGDLGKKDKEGYIYIVDRVKDMIIRGGFNVYPREIEEVLITHPDVSFAAVIGVPDDKMGEEVKAYLVPKEGKTIDPEKIMQWSKENMADYKYPRMIEICGSLPMTATGKILKKELKAKLK